MDEAGTKGNKMPRGKKEEILKFSITLPDPEEQNRIITEIEKYESLIEKAKLEIKNCSIRKQLIVQKLLF